MRNEGNEIKELHKITYKTVRWLVDFLKTVFTVSDKDQKIQVDKKKSTYEGNPFKIATDITIKSNINKAIKTTNGPNCTHKKSWQILVVLDWKIAPAKYVEIRCPCDSFNFY